MTTAPPERRLKGFTLTELAIVLIIVALMIGGLMATLSTSRDIANDKEAAKQLSEISAALIGFAASHSAADARPYLPCPDTDNNGSENRVAGACTALEGSLPWLDLGLAQEDIWGNRYRYRVSANFSNSVTGFSLPTVGTLRVCQDAACALVLANNIPAVFVTHGKNGAGALNLAGGTNTAPSGADELANTDNNNDFVARTTGNNAGNDYDDIVTWIPSSILLNRMISAGRLP